MSKTATALIVKFVLTFAAAWMAFAMIDGNAVSWAVVIAILGTVVNYFIGDLIVLPAYRNVMAALGDGIMAVLLAYVVDLFATGFQTTFSGLLAFGALVIFAEYFFHIYIKSKEEVAPKGNKL